MYFHRKKVEKQTEDVFDEQFWKSKDFMLQIQHQHLLQILIQHLLQIQLLHLR